MRPPVLSDDAVTMGEIFGLLMECPRCGGNPDDCQLHEMRKLTLHERYVWAKDIPLAEIAKIRRRCAQCVHRRDDETPPASPDPASKPAGESTSAS